MDYELYVQTEKGGAWERLDLPELSIPMNYQINTLAELKDRNGAYSQSILFPRSPHNMKIFGFGLDIDVISDIPYKRHRCQLFCNGILASPPGAVLVVNALKRNTIETNIVSGTVDLVNILKSKPMTSAETDGFWRMLDISNIAGEVTTLSNGVKLAYPFATLMTNIPENGFNSTPKGFTGDSAHIYPHLNFYDTVVWILRQEGYSLETNLKLADKQAFIPCIVPKAVYVQQNSIAHGEGNIEKEDVQKGVGWSITDPVSNRTYPGVNGHLYYYAYADGPVEFNLKVYSGVQYGSVFVQVMKVSNGIQATIIDERLIGGFGSKNYVRTIELEKNDYLYIAVLGSAPTIPFTLYCDMEIVLNIPDLDGEPTVSVVYDLLNSLGFKTRYDLLNTFIKFYGLTIDIDPEDKVVRAYSFDKIYGNKVQAYDWSGKLAMDRDTDINYRADGYAKTNLIQMKENKDNGVTDIFSFPIADDSLDDEKNLYSVDFMVTGNSRYPEDYVTINYPIYEIERTDDGNEMNFKAKYKKPTAPHIVSLSTYRDLGINVTQGSASKRVSLYLARTYTLTKVLPNYIGRLKDDILNRYKKLTAYFALTPADIEDIDLFTPVWLEQYGYYFYIAKINNFIAGKLTKVDLIRM